MPDTLERLQKIKHRHNFFNRLITLCLSAFVCGIGFLLWMAEISLLDQYIPGTGLVIIGFATMFYKTPYFSYCFNRRYFANDEAMMHLMGNNWQDYKIRILNI